MSRLNKKTYERKHFLDHGIDHHDLYFVDGTPPPIPILDKFLQICENTEGICAAFTRTCSYRVRSTTLLSVAAARRHNCCALQGRTRAYRHLHRSERCLGRSVQSFPFLVAQDAT